MARFARLAEARGGGRRTQAHRCACRPDEELAAITFMAARTPSTPALLFNKLVGHGGDARVLANILGASKARYAIAVGLDRSSAPPT